MVLESIPGAVDSRQEYTLDSNVWHHAYTHLHTKGLKVPNKKVLPKKPLHHSTAQLDFVGLNFLQLVLLVFTPFILTMMNDV